MAPKRGMSAEDKRKTLLAIFHESKDVFVLKVETNIWLNVNFARLLGTEEGI